MSLCTISITAKTAAGAALAGAVLTFTKSPGDRLTTDAGAAVWPLAVQVVFTLGLGMLAATLNVFFRDVAQLVQVGLLFWFWLTPIVYPMNVLPAWAQGWVWLNPFAVLMHHYQQVLLFGRLPDVLAWQRLGVLALVALALLLWGWRVYRARAPEMADEL